MLSRTTRQQKLTCLGACRVAIPTICTTTRRRYFAPPQTSWKTAQSRSCQAITSTRQTNACLSRQSRWVDLQKKNGSRSYSLGRLPMSHRAFVALGSNMGDRVAMIERACKLMEATGQVKILQTSSLYETKAMYVLDQDNFVNGACEVSCTSYMCEAAY